MSNQIPTQPTVSVIIPTYNRKDSLLRTLESLAQQTYPAERFEVIVVDDGGTDGTESITEWNFPFALRYLRQENQGDAMARNTGARQAIGKFLVFLDDDILIEPECIYGFVEGFHNNEKCIVMGLLKPWLELEKASPFESVNYNAWLISSPQIGEVSFTESLSGFMAIRKDNFFCLGMMQPVNTEGSSVWCDVEFAYRAHLEGFTFYRGAIAIGYHDDYAWRDLSVTCRRTERAAFVGAGLFHKHPELKAYIPMFRDKGPIAWTEDSPRLILRKLARQVASSQPVMWAMENLIPTLERRAPTSTVLRLLYRWIVSGYIYRGYRAGLRDLKH